MREPQVLELLFQNHDCFSHILQQIFLYLDSYTLKNLTLVSKEMNEFVNQCIWKNSRARSAMRRRLRRSWLRPIPGPVTKESAFQCSDDAFDLKIRGNSIICGLRNGTVEIWNTLTLEREMTLTDQQGSVQVDANDSVVAGVSSDSTVCVWDRQTGKLKDIFYHHRASTWGISIEGDHLITGSMDGTLAVIDLITMSLTKQFLAHEDEWGVSDLATNKQCIVSGCFGRRLKVWNFPDCDLIRTIDTGHAVNCVDVHENLAATCSRTGKRQQVLVPNVKLWDLNSGHCIKSFDLPSACFVQLDKDKLVTLVAAGDGIIGELHVIKWPIAKILIIPRDSSWNSNYNLNQEIRSSQAEETTTSRGEILLRYQHTPSVVASRDLLVYTQPRTQGMCSILNFWPTSKDWVFPKEIGNLIKEDL